MEKKKAPKKEKGKKEKKKKPARKAHRHYDLSGSELKRKNSTCPKCGPGVFMAQHKDRISCGCCSYTEFKKKK